MITAELSGPHVAENMGMISTSPPTEIANVVTDRLTREKEELIGMEDLQDAVEEELMRQGYY